MSASESEEVEVEGQFETEDPDKRWVGLSTAVGFLIAIHYPALVVAAALGVVDLEAIPQPYYLADTLGWLGVMTYIFGEKTIASAKEALGK